MIRACKKPIKDSTLVDIRSSEGTADICQYHTHRTPITRVIDDDAGHVLRLPTSATDDRVERVVSGWNWNLQRLGLRVSTGPVVAFRTREFHRQENAADSVPFLWLHNVGTMQITWPKPKKRKPQFFAVSADAASLLIPRQNMVVLRRFSSKEQNRRLTAAPLLSSELPRGSVALENHLNYIVATGATLPAAQATGLAALLNSSLLDTYFRISSGNTQVSATELRKLPFPAPVVLKDIGERFNECELCGMPAVEESVKEVLELDDLLVEAIQS